ncbi:MAG: SDR family oxidoreductase, partial [Pseudomonadales bacterium]|nr:SDR family oxidoreductase [Pseudomonadales bacterium]
MNLNLEGKTALITGASKGIGFACAMALAREGCDVRLVARTLSDLETALERILSETNVKVEIFPADLSQSDAVTSLMSENTDIDILVNNAGAIPVGFIHQVDEATWRESWDLKVFGYINMCRAAYTNMMNNGGGVIINVIGVGGEKPTAGYIAGGAGNAALMALTRGLGATSSRHGIRVVAINPGQIHTERLETMLRAAAVDRFGDEDRWQELLDSRYPPGEPARIGDMAAFLASDLSAFTTGTIITVDGGAAS